MAKYVSFLTLEDEDDLIVSFALGEHAITSLTLLRTPKYEMFLPDEERGVSVGSDSSESFVRELLVSVRWGKDLVRIESTVRRYALDIRALAPDDIREARRILAKMNFDARFEVLDV